MKKVLLGAAAAAAAVAYAPAVNATIFPVGSPNFFITTGTPTSPSITAIFFDSFKKSTIFDDIYTFTIPQNGVGSGSISTSFSSSSKNKLFITDLLINGVSYTVPVSSSGQSVSVGDIPILDGVLNTIEVKGFTKGSGSYSGTATFAAVPEPASWAMMLGGFGLLGAAMRRGRKTTLSFS